MTTTTHVRKTRSNKRARPSPLLIAAGVAIVLAAVAALIVTRMTDESTDTIDFDTAEATVDGGALTALPASGNDPAVGQASPIIEGHDRDGGKVTAPVRGRPTVLLFVTHWCGVCQREVPAVQGWIDAGKIPADVDLVAVATAMSPSRPNYPTSAWLDREQWTPTTIADANGAAAVAFGLPAFPYWVAIDAQGRVAERRAGALDLDDLVELADAAAGQRRN